jgi:hypothetical protein
VGHYHLLLELGGKSGEEPVRVVSEGNQLFQKLLQRKDLAEVALWVVVWKTNLATGLEAMRAVFPRTDLVSECVVLAASMRKILF